MRSDWNPIRKNLSWKYIYRTGRKYRIQYPGGFCALWGRTYRISAPCSAGTGDFYCRKERKCPVKGRRRASGSGKQGRYEGKLPALTTNLNFPGKYLVLTTGNRKIGFSGKLTKEEFEAMKQHTIIGARMLDSLEMYHDEEMMKYAYEICRWHHERYDGKGYPDGLKGEEIPISAQVVSLADVYDALVSDRVYKKAYSHEKAMEMILNGECGMFNPLLWNVWWKFRIKYARNLVLKM